MPVGFEAVEPATTVPVALSTRKRSRSEVMPYSGSFQPSFMRTERPVARVMSSPESVPEPVLKSWQSVSP